MKRKLIATMASLLFLSTAWITLSHAATIPVKSLDQLPERVELNGKRTFVFSPQLKAWAAYDKDGYRVANGKADGGGDYCADIKEPCRTPVGTFRIFRQKGVNCQSSTFPIETHGGAPMPYCMFFKGGAAIHGSKYLANENNSHGCIRVQTAAAQWLQRYFIRIETQVIVLPY